MRPVEDYMSVDFVLKNLTRRLQTPPAVEQVGIKSAYGRTVAHDMLVDVNIPEFAKSHMDGFAIASRDTRSASVGQPVRLYITGEVSLGDVPKIPVGAGEAVRVATGSLMPEGADAVVPSEEAEVKGTTVVLKSSIKAGAFVYRKGEDLKQGEVGIAGGTNIRAQDIGLLAALGLKQVDVFRRPRVGILATGSELTESARPTAGKVRESHTPVFERMVRAAECIPVSMGIARDNEKELKTKLLAALAGTDIVLTLGGTSVGEHDLLGKVVAKLSPEVFFHGIRMDRGRVAGAAIVRGKPVVMMPGPIQGAMNAFVLLALPVLRKLQGRGGEELTVGAELGRRWEARKRFPHFTKVVYVHLHSRDGRLIAEPVVAETESIRILTRSNGFLVVPEETASLSRGDEVDVLLLPGFSFAG